jgi:hypothetical protein
MATRSIVTSQPDVACDVCGRRLLRGEQPNAFLAGGQRRIVCELCSPRATHEGWLREADGLAVGLRSSRPQRGRTLLGKLRQSRWPVSDRSVRDGTPAQADLGWPSHVRGAELYDFLDGSPASTIEEQPSADASTQTPLPEDYPNRERSARAPLGAEQGALETPITNGEAKVARALEVFNAGEHPRRVAGVARSLGTPCVSTRSVAHTGSVVAIVVAWELCWYRYEVDLGDEAAGARVASQGTELHELLEEDRVGNATADERGELALLGA